MEWRGVGSELEARSREERGVEEGSRIRIDATDVRGIISALVVVIGVIPAVKGVVINIFGRIGQRNGEDVEK